MKSEKSNTYADKAIRQTDFSLFTFLLSTKMNVVYEDNHIIIVNKLSGEIVQGDKTGDRTLADDVKAYIKEEYAKPGNVFLGVTHRLDRPVWGLVVFAKTSKALSRLNDMFRNGDIHKTYWAICQNAPAEQEATLTHWLTRNERQNKSYAYDREVPGAKKAVLHYKVIGRSERYTLVEVQLMTGRHHQIRSPTEAYRCLHARWSLYIRYRKSR